MDSFCLALAEIIGTISRVRSWIAYEVADSAITGGDAASAYQDQLIDLLDETWDTMSAGSGEGVCDSSL